ncbi:Uncharacterised protein g2738 [Pycnogonum litorale]
MISIMSNSEAGATPGDPERRSDGDGAEYTFKPNEEMLNLLLGMGLSRNASVKALFYTGNKSADLAASWIFENPSRDLNDPLESEEIAARINSMVSTSDDEDEVTDSYKMVFVVNKELQMGVGKIAAQVAHAALGMHRLLLEDEYRYGSMLLQWEDYGATKIVLQADTTTQLKDLENKAKAASLPTYLVHDAGHTQVAAGSATVLGIMGRTDSVDGVTGSLRLL